MLTERKTSAYADSMVAVDILVRAASNADDPGEGLRAIAALKRLSDDLEVLHVERARDLGWTWQQIAEALGVTRQTVHRKHQTGATRKGKG